MTPATKQDTPPIFRGQPPAQPAALRAYMAWHRVRQVDVGRALGLGQPYISGVLAGKVPASRKALARLRAAIQQVLDGRRDDADGR